jgi:3-deoxy-D-manno-octulosonate 8-phosphate phosphatase KdsC-like HAD superfamily phosphatase
VGFSACPNDAIDSVKEKCDYICNNIGGNGCVREFVEKILKEYV